jgi:hypothetical protein
VENDPNEARRKFLLLLGDIALVLLLFGSLWLGAWYAQGGR